MVRDDDPALTCHQIILRARSESGGDVGRACAIPCAACKLTDSCHNVGNMEFIGAMPTVDLTYSDVFLVPRRSDVGSRLSVELAPGDGTPATLPLVAANMNAVTGPRLAAVLARRGGLAVLPQDLALADMEDAIRWVKAQSPDFDTATVTLDALTAAGAPTVEAAELADARAAFDVVHAALAASQHGAASDSGNAAGMVAVVRDGALIGTLSERQALRRNLYAPALDANGRLAVAAAVGINGDVGAKARALAAAGADVLVIDTAHGHQEGMLRAIDTVASLGLGLPIVAGNIVTADGVADLVAAGATILKVGVGPGAMCTTRMMTAVGRPQFSAVLETAQAARELGAHVWADGGVRYPRDVALALAAGASSVMIGSWFAGTIESPGEVQLDADGRAYKESWGMASTKAVQGRFGGLDAYERARKELFAEGISSSKIYLDPQRPGVEDLLDMITSGVRSSFTYAGAATLQDFHVLARVGLQSAAGYEEGKALPVSW